MALPSSGQLSLSQIATELGQGYLSLRSLSSAAGFGTPDAISEFHGYGTGGGGGGGGGGFLVMGGVYLGDPCNNMYGDIIDVDGKYFFRDFRGDTLVQEFWYSLQYEEGGAYYYQVFGVDKGGRSYSYRGDHTSYCEPFVIK